MTTIVNGTRPAVTVGDVAGVAGAHGNPAGSADPAGSDADAVCTRVIPHNTPSRQRKPDLNRALRAVGVAVGETWPMTEHPVPLAQAWHTIIPTRAEAGGRLGWVWMFAAGLFRAAVVGLGTLLIAVVAGEPQPDGTRTRYRAAAALAVTAAVTAAHFVARHLGG